MLGFSQADSSCSYATATTCVAKATRVALATHVRRCSFSYSDKCFARLRREG